MNTLLIKQAAALIEDESDVIAILANISALINDTYENLNWVGFYLFKKDHLVLGPFQGKVACTRLYPGKGVCSHALKTRTVQNIPDVHAFPGHIACDSASNSELVIPLYIDDAPFGVLDIDSPLHQRFTSEDEATFAALGALLIQKLQTHI